MSYTASARRTEASVVRVLPCCNLISIDPLIDVNAFLSVRVSLRVLKYLVCLDYEFYVFVVNRHWYKRLYSSALLLKCSQNRECHTIHYSSLSVICFILYFKASASHIEITHTKHFLLLLQLRYSLPTMTMLSNNICNQTELGPTYWKAWVAMLSFLWGYILPKVWWSSAPKMLLPLLC